MPILRKSQNLDKPISGQQIVQTTQKLACKLVSWMPNMVYLQICLFKISSQKKIGGTGHVSNTP